MGDKKKFKDTKFGKTLLKIIPSAGDLVGNLLPDKGVLGMVKNLITKSDISDDDKQSLLIEHSELEKEYLKDVQNARDNETARDTDPNSSWLSKNIHELIAGTIVSAWVFTWFYKPEIGYAEITGVVTLILGYLYGRSKPQG